MNNVGAAYVLATNTPQMLVPASGDAKVYRDIVSLVMSSENAAVGSVLLSDGTTTYRFVLAPFGNIPYTPSIPLPATSPDTAWQVSNTTPGGAVECVVSWVERT